jgi:hypothetical protein
LLVDAAQIDLFKDDWGSALQKLAEAQRYGGQQSADWHVTYGAIGYFSDGPPAESIPYFKRALQIDPYHPKARALLARVQARLEVRNQRVSPRMGLTPQNPIKVISQQQEIEYLKLFGVKVIRQQKIPEKSLHVWHGTSQQGEAIAYYFDCSQMNRWAVQNASPHLP